MIAKLTVAAVLAAATASTPAACDTKPLPATTHQPALQNVEVQTMCDENGNAYDIRPDTPLAHARAVEMCANPQRSLKAVGW